mmetsp:Transcript_64637/g.166340  ORF Transcript_64637/g.166340 Transcript_64637/m.166340 type:complete len:228 (-) Transcript_64637:84-767(-)
MGLSRKERSTGGAGGAGAAAGALCPLSPAAPKDLLNAPLPAATGDSGLTPFISPALEPKSAPGMNLSNLSTSSDCCLTAGIVWCAFTEARRCGKLRSCTPRPLSRTGPLHAWPKRRATPARFLRAPQSRCWRLSSAVWNCSEATAARRASSSAFTASTDSAFSGRGGARRFLTGTGAAGVSFFAGATAGFATLSKAEKPPRDRIANHGVEVVGQQPGLALCRPLRYR